MSFRSLTPWRRQRHSVSNDFNLPFTSFQDELDQLFNSLAPRFFQEDIGENALNHHLTRVDIVETDEAVEVTADMPGMSEDDIDIVLNDNILTLKGQREHEEEDKRKDYHRIERSFGTYFRRIALPAEVDEEGVRAEFSKGVLKIVLPKSVDERTHTRRIPITPI